MRTLSLVRSMGLITALLVFAGAAVLVSASDQPRGESPARPLTPIPNSSGRMVVPDRQKLLRGAEPAQGYAAPAAAIMTQDFEGSWPASGWQLLDESSLDGGEYLFGKRNCRPHTGSYAGWSVGGGAQGGALGCSASFPDNVDSSAIYGPFDLTGAASAQLIFYLWGRVQVSPGCDNAELFVASSIDNRRYTGSTYCGDYTNGTEGNGYYRLTFDLNQRLGRSQVWVAFNFASSDSIPDIGFTIDDIRLEVGSAPTSTSTATSTPTMQETPTPTPTMEATPTPTATTVVVHTPTPTATPTSLRRIWLPMLLRDYPAATPERPQ